MKIDILICTFNNRIKEVPSILLDPHPDITYYISHQVSVENMGKVGSPPINRADVVYSQHYSRGLAINRNHAFDMAKGDICFIADDDVRYTIEEILQVKEYLENHPEIDILVGKIRTYPGEPEYKNYSPHVHNISWNGIGSVSSIEMVVRRKAIVDNGIKFDEDFGLGGKLYKKGEEAIFLSECLRKHLRIHYFPEYIVSHPYESSTTNTIYDDSETEYTGALSYRVFKTWGYLFGPIFALKHYNRYKENLNVAQYLKNFYKGLKISKVK